MAKTKKPNKLGSGKRFKMLEEQASKIGAKDPAAVAAAAGRAAHGQKTMTRYSKMGKARKSG